MSQYTILHRYNLIKINPSPEIWLKSMKVRMRMVKILMNNIKQSLTQQEIPYHKYQLTADSTRILFFFDNENLQKAMKALEKVFGIESFSPALRTSNKLEKIIQRTLEVGNEILQINDTFAIRVKRSGRHDYTSQDVAKKSGQAVLENFSGLNLKVNLSNPIKTIFIEIRGDFSYIFTDIIKSRWVGLPIERNKKIMCMDIGRLNDMIAGFLIMRRGCDIYPVLFKLTNNTTSLEKWLSNWKEIAKYNYNLRFTIRIINLVPVIEHIKENLRDKKYVCAICRLIRFELISKLLKESQIKDLEKIEAFSDGMSLDNNTFCFDEIDLESISVNYIFSDYPIFTPLVGLEKNEIDQIISDISENLKPIDYCLFKPKDQEIERQNLEKIYKSLNLNNLIMEVLKDIVVVNIT